MKNICLLVLLIAHFNSYSQETSKPLFLKKSGKQKTAAWSMLAGGFTCMTVALVSSGSSGTNAKAGSLRTIEFLFGAGALCTVGSIPLFIIAGKNRKRGLKLTVNSESLIVFYDNHQALRQFPSLAVSIHL